MGTLARIAAIFMFALLVLCIFASLKLSDALFYDPQSALYSLDHPANVICGVKELGFREYNAPPCVKTLSRIGAAAG